MPLGIYERKQRPTNCHICGKQIFVKQKRKENFCIDCNKDRHRQQNSTSKAKLKAQNKWNRGDRTAQSRRWRQNHHKQYLASATVWRAKKKGILVKPEHCEECNRKTSNLEAHHDDYNKPLEVKWLCRKKCHQKYKKNGGV